MNTGDTMSEGSTFRPKAWSSMTLTSTRVTARLRGEVIFDLDNYPAKGMSINDARDAAVRFCKARAIQETPSRQGWRVR